MSPMRWVLVLGTVCLLMGCQQNQGGPEVPPAVPASPETRARLQKLDPTARIGRVVAVLPDQRLVSVAEIPVKEFRSGDVVSFVGGDETPLGTGVVVAVVNDSLHVRYTDPAPGQRPPAVGDLAIRFTDARR